ncbi:MAG TPA: DnaA N-terminal domain-containing protein [Vicinamibacterales bacterium]|nr:DnaA N-terminal domain-containing protein [Vicinamibacterales bacterium]
MTNADADRVKQLTARIEKLEEAMRSLQLNRRHLAVHGESAGREMTSDSSLEAQARVHEEKWARFNRVASRPQVWDDALEIVRTKVEPHVFAAWFLGSTIELDEGERLTISTDSPLRSQWLARRFTELIRAALADAGRPGVQVTFVSRY